MLTPMPIISDRRKLPLMCIQKSRILNFASIFTDSASMRAIDPTNSSYMPIMKAMVPPDTPGMTSAAPLQAPLTDVSRYFLRLFITVF